MPMQMALLTKEREEALGDARQCRADAAPLEAPDTYAQAAKMQRRAIMREKHAAQLDSLKVTPFFSCRVLTGSQAQSTPAATTACCNACRAAHASLLVGM